MFVCETLQIIRLTFQSFATEENADIAWIYDGNSAMNHVIMGMTDNTYQSSDVLLSSIYSSGSAVFVQFTSDDMVGKSGVWGHFGSWDFDRALIYNTLKKKE